MKTQTPPLYPLRLNSTQAEGRGSIVFPAESFFGRRGLRGGGWPNAKAAASLAGAAQENNAGKLPLLGDRGVIPPCQPYRAAAGLLALPANPGFSGGNQFCPGDLDEESEKEGGSNLDGLARPPERFIRRSP